MATKNGVREEEMHMLSETERAALEDDTPEVPAGGEVIPDDPVTAPAASATDPADDAATNDDAADDADDAAAAAAAATTADAADAADAGAADDNDNDTDTPFIPQYIAQPVDNYNQAMATLNKQFEDAEITLAEYNTQRDDLIRRQTKAEIAAEQNEQLAQQRWDWEVKHFIKDIRRNEGVDYDKPLLGAALDTAVKSLATQKDAQGNLVHGDKDGEWFLSEAHKQIKAEFNLGKPTPIVPPPNGGKPPAGKPRAVPTTLGAVPAAEIPDTGDTDPFSGIDKLIEQGRTEEAEMKLAGLSKADQQRYLRAS